MNKYVTLIACLIILVFRNTAIAQDASKIIEDKESKKDTRVYNIKSLEGKDQQVHVMPGYNHHVLRISCLKDTITDYDFWGVPVEVRILNKQFIEIKYRIRAGVGMDAVNMMLLCVSGGKLCEALHAEGLFSDEDGGVKESYNIDIATLEGNSKKDYKLIVNIHDYYQSRSNPEENYNYSNQSILSFDTSRHVFYSIKTDLFDNFINVYNARTSKLIYKRKIKGNFPITILGKETYYFIKGEWYQLGNSKELDKYAPNTTK